MESSFYSKWMLLLSVFTLCFFVSAAECWFINISKIGRTKSICVQDLVFSVMIENSMHCPYGRESRDNQVYIKREGIFFWPLFCFCHWYPLLGNYFWETLPFLCSVLFLSMYLRVWRNFKSGYSISWSFQLCPWFLMFL